MTRYEISQDGLRQTQAEQGMVTVAVSPDEAECAWIKSQFLLDEYDLTSTLDPDEVPRVDYAHGRLLLIWKVPDATVVTETVELGVSSMALSINQDQLIIVRSGGSVSFTDREFRSVRDARDVMLALLVRTVRHFVGHLKVIRQISHEIEQKITVSMENKHLLQMFSLSESLVYYQDAIEGNAAALARLRGMAVLIGFDNRQIEQLEDIVLENTQAARQADIFASVLSGLMDARGTIVNNNMNVLLKNLTLINIVFLPLNLIASIGGMSEWSMMTDKLDWRLSYFLFCVMMVVVGWGTWLFMTKVFDPRVGGVRRRS